MAALARSAFLIPALTRTGAGDTTRAYVNRLPERPNDLFWMLANRFVERGRRTGWFQDHTQILAFFPPSQGGCTVNLCAAGLSGGAVSGGVTFTRYRSLLTDGVSGYVNPGLQWTDIVNASLNQHGMWAFCASGGSSTGMQMGATGGGNEIAFRALNGINANFFDGSTSSDLLTSNSSIGFTGLFRNNSATYVARQRGVEKEFTRAAPTAWPTVAPAIGRLGVSGGTYLQASFVLAGFLGGSATLNSEAMRDDLEDACNNLVIGLGILTADDLNPETPSVVLPGVFDATGPYSISAVTPANLRVMQQINPPLSTDTVSTYAYFFGSDFATTQIGKLVSNNNPNVNGHGWLWAMRPNTNPNRQPNPLFAAGFRVTLIDGVTTKAPAMEFSTLAIAKAATLASCAYMLGHAAHEAGGTGYADYWNAAGLSDATIYTNAYAAANATAIFTRTPTKGAGTDQICSLDTLTLPPARQSDATLANMRKGVLVDYELAIDMTSAETIDYTDAVCDIIQAAGYEAIFYPNDLNGGNGSQESLNDPVVARHINAKWDWLGIVAWPRNDVGGVRTEIINQLNLLPSTSTFSKIMLIVGMGQTASNRTTLGDAAILRKFLDGTDAYMAGRKIRFLSIWRYYGVAGGNWSSYYNQVLAALGGMTPP